MERSWIMALCWQNRTQQCGRILAPLPFLDFYIIIFWYSYPIDINIHKQYPWHVGQTVVLNPWTFKGWALQQICDAMMRGPNGTYHPASGVRQDAAKPTERHLPSLHCKCILHQNPSKSTTLGSDNRIQCTIKQETPLQNIPENSFV